MYVTNIFAIIIISFLFLYSLVTYHWKGLKERYNFVIGNISIKIYDETKFGTHFFLGAT